MSFTKAPNEQTAQTEYERLVARIGAYLREHDGKPIRAIQPILVAQRDVDGRPFAALCTHFAYGVSATDAVQSLLCQLVGGSGGVKEGSDTRNEDGAAPPGKI